jgi:hypothetical protein
MEPELIDRAWFESAVSAISVKLPAESARKWETQSGKVCFKYWRAAFHKHMMEVLYQQMMRATDVMRLTASDDQIIYSGYTGPLAEPFFFNLDGFFESLKAAQDFVLPCLASAHVLRSPPNSLHRFCKNRTTLASTHLDRSLLAAWDDVGRRTKHLRDCFSHHASLSGHIWQNAINMKWDTTRWHASVTLPDNPEANSYDQFTYHKRIEALEHCTMLLEGTGRLLQVVFAAALAHHGASVTDVTNQTFTIRGVRIGD